MKRLLKKISFNLGSTVRFKNNPYEKGVFTVIRKNEDGTYELTDQNGDYSTIEETELTDAKNFIVGDKVKFKKHPYDNQETFEVKDVLPNDNYYIVSDNNAFTNINKINLELIQE